MMGKKQKKKETQRKKKTQRNCDSDDFILYVRKYSDSEAPRFLLIKN